MADGNYGAKGFFRPRCGCGGHASQAEHDAAFAGDHVESLVRRSVLRAMLPDARRRRDFLRTVGAASALAAIGQVLPTRWAAEALADAGKPERADLKIGFIPITCATPIIMAEPMGFYRKQGLAVQVVKTAGWAVVRDKTLNKEYDAAHMLAPMPIALSMGLGSSATPFMVPLIENINGQAICLAMKHKDERDPAKWQGFKFGIPFEYSNHNYLLRYYLAEHGIDPDRDVQLRTLPPPELVANLRAGNIDGFLAPDNIVQRAVYDGVGFIHLLSKEIWDGHPCCSFAVSQQMAAEAPNATAAMLRAIIEATAYASKPEHRKEIAAAIAPANYLNQPLTVVEQVLTGTYADGLGHVRTDPDRVAFDPFPYDSFAVWTLTQMKRWGQIKGDVDYAGVARQVYRATDAQTLMAQAGLTPPKATSKTFVVMGKAFDPAKPKEYLDSFKIKREG